MYKAKKAAAVLLTIFLTGCGVVQKTQDMQQEETITSMEEEPELSYEVPVSSPNILVNQLGYITGSTKVAVFCGEEMPQTFRVIEQETGEVAFEGILENGGYNQTDKEYNSYGDFSQLNKSGTYYIEAPILGRSYSFSIGDNLYDDIFEEACKQYYYNRCGITLTAEYAGQMAHNACHTGYAVLRQDISVNLDVSGGWHQDEKGSKDVALASQNIGIILLAYELYQESFTDTMGIPESGNGIPDILDEVRYEVEWLLKMQDGATGAVYEGVTVYEQDLGKGSISYVEPVDMRATKAFSMVLAKFSYLYQVYDTEYATNCLKAADRAWRYVRLNDQEDVDAWQFAAAAEIYRASGQQECNRCLIEYLRKKEYKEEMDEAAFLGCITYLSTTQPVNVELCEEIIQEIMAKAEEAASSARGSLYYVNDNKEQDDNDVLLENMVYLTTVDHIITNHEYEMVIENHLHYFMGRNAQAISYIDGAGEKSYRDIDENLGIMKRFDANSKWIFMLSEIVGSHRR